MGHTHGTVCITELDFLVWFPYLPLGADFKIVQAVKKPLGYGLAVFKQSFQHLSVDIIYRVVRGTVFKNIRETIVHT